MEERTEERNATIQVREVHVTRGWQIFTKDGGRFDPNTNAASVVRSMCALRRKGGSMGGTIVVRRARFPRMPVSAAPTESVFTISGENGLGLGLSLDVWEADDTLMSLPPSSLLSFLLLKIFCVAITAPEVESRENRNPPMMTVTTLRTYVFTHGRKKGIRRDLRLMFVNTERMYACKIKHR